MSERENDMRFGIILGACLGFLLALSIVGCPEEADAAPPTSGYATYYNLESCKREGTSGITASGEPLDDNALTCASWNYKFGTLLRVTHGDRSVVVRCNDRGPGRKARRRGVIIDLTEAAFKRLTDGDLKVGKIRVTVKEIAP